MPKTKFDYQLRSLRSSAPAVSQKPTAMRYYEQRYPEVDELVMVQVRQIAEMGAYVKLVRLAKRTCRAADERTLRTARIRQHRGNDLAL